jgi:UPF0755 protein
MKKLIALIGILGIVLWSSWRLWYALALRPVDSGDQTRITVMIPSGASSETIGELLEEKGVVRSAYAFKTYAKKSGVAAKLLAGTFVLRPNMNVKEVVGILSSGEHGEVSVTIPEGYTVKDIDELLVKKGLIEPGELSLCVHTCDFSSFEFLPNADGVAERGGRLEGYLYPDTYFVDASQFVPKFFLERLLGTFRSRVITDLAKDIQASKRSLHEIMTMASLIEEETITDEERPIVSGILWKRFDEGIGLYVDASNRYILDKPTGVLTASDLDMDSNYNLRKYRGLPPGPIANPSLGSIKAALHPQSSPYYYYLHDKNGVVHYAVTNEEHNANRAKYLQ